MFFDDRKKIIESIKPLKTDKGNSKKLLLLINAIRPLYHFNGLETVKMIDKIVEVESLAIKKIKLINSLIIDKSDVVKDNMAELEKLQNEFHTKLHNFIIDNEIDRVEKSDLITPIVNSLMIGLILSLVGIIMLIGSQTKYPFILLISVTLASSIFDLFRIFKIMMSKKYEIDMFYNQPYLHYEKCIEYLNS